MRYFIQLSYNGAHFCGWQIQQNANSVQAELQKAFSTILKENITITGAGRTDTGVNAIDYIAHFDYHKAIENTDFVIYKINAILPKGIALSKIFLVHNTAHARFDAIKRTYKYHIHTHKDPFNHQLSYFVPPNKLDFEKMNEAAKYFLGEQDFTSLEKLNGGNNTSICTVTEAFWSYNKDEHYVFTVSANRFLRNMVRAMVGSLIEVGIGRKEPEWIINMLKEKNRGAAGHSVPGTALFLTKIEYPYSLVE